MYYFCSTVLVKNLIHINGFFMVHQIHQPHVFSVNVK